MTTIPAQFKARPVPQVNLMPPEVGQRRAKSRRRTVVVLLFALFLLAIAAGYVFIAMLSAQAQADAQAEADRTVLLQEQIAALSEVDVVKAKLANSESARLAVANTELFWPLMLSAIDGALPDTSRVQSIQFAMPEFAQAPAGASSPLDIPGVSLVSMTVAVPAYVDASFVEDRLNEVPFFARARVSQVWQEDTTGGEDPDPDAPPIFMMDLTFIVTYDGLMMRYSPLWFGADGQGESLQDYYEALRDSLIAGNGIGNDYPPLPEVTPPPFIPGVVGPAEPPAEVAPDPSASPTPEATS
jgi:hypothetical protein